MAVLCVTDHDRHHRVSAYAGVNHLELTQKVILDHKHSWEAFVADARSENPTVVATISSYGTETYVHSAELVMQWPGRIVYRKVYHLRMGNIDLWTNAMLAEVAEVGRKIKIIMISEPLPSHHCPTCRTGLSTRLNYSKVVQLTHTNWAAESICGVFVYPDRPAIDLAINFSGQTVFEAWLHLCGRMQLHVATNEYDERIDLRRLPSVRNQVKFFIEKLLSDWQPGTVLFATGSVKKPNFTPKLVLPRCWEGSSPHPCHALPA